MFFFFKLINFNKPKNKQNTINRLKGKLERYQKRNKKITSGVFFFFQSFNKAVANIFQSLCPLLQSRPE